MLHGLQTEMESWLDLERERESVDTARVLRVVINAIKAKRATPPTPPPADLVGLVERMRHALDHEGPIAYGNACSAVLAWTPTAPVPAQAGEPTRQFATCARCRGALLPAGPRSIFYDGRRIDFPLAQMCSVCGRVLIIGDMLDELNRQMDAALAVPPVAQEPVREALLRELARHPRGLSAADVATLNAPVEEPAPQEPPTIEVGHDLGCEAELTSHGYTECRCDERARPTPGAPKP